MKKVQVLLVVLSLFILSSEYLLAQRVTGSGPMVTENISMNKISSISLGISANVYLKQGKSQSIEVKGQKNIIDLLNKKASGDTWEIKFPSNSNVKMNEKMEIHITIADLESLNIGGSGSIIGENGFKNLGDVKMNIGGSGSIKLSLDAEDLNCNIGGSGSIKLSGTADHLDGNIGGSGSIKAIDLKVKTAKTNTAGSGSVAIDVEDKLSATIVGSGGVKYKGNPKVSKTEMGSGRVKSY